MRRTQQTETFTCDNCGAEAVCERDRLVPKGWLGVTFALGVSRSAPRPAHNAPLAAGYHEEQHLCGRDCYFGRFRSVAEALIDEADANEKADS